MGRKVENVDLSIWCVSVAEHIPENNSSLYSHQSSKNTIKSTQITLSYYSYSIVLVKGFGGPTDFFRTPLALRRAFSVVQAQCRSGFGNVNGIWMVKSVQILSYKLKNFERTSKIRWLGSCFWYLFVVSPKPWVLGNNSCEKSDCHLKWAVLSYLKSPDLGHSKEQS